ncbi:uncharacterized protein DUF4244 [Isoptericola sp. CG 20/1183]|uniref:Uncharacterized protein DUF4244 n=1 Tax=Isoptericola halotolerans TaxID=300560 RepID=A0ABX5EIL0_9MICO|nr:MULTISPECIES: DUF4244 domain-containing protein [Isoptericola]PRZ09471.1 uncharacterized protein DUF4244 [Isoptericola sp. CG 20/1183]PRZ10272.1 uncharacterized protein DUF4244 [Isoptericola halotolerans]
MTEKTQRVDDDLAPGVPAGAPGTGRSDALDPEAGLATAEYAIATIAAVGFAGLLILVLQSDAVRGMLESIISSALSV